MRAQAAFPAALPHPGGQSLVSSLLSSSILRLAVAGVVQATRSGTIITVAQGVLWTLVNPLDSPHMAQMPQLCTLPHGTVQWKYASGLRAPSYLAATLKITKETRRVH